MAIFCVGTLLLLLLLLIYYYKSGPRTTPIAHGERKWNVIGSFADRARAAEMLDRANSTMIEFMRILRRKYHIDETAEDISRCETHMESMSKESYKIISTLLDNYNPEVFYENDPRTSNETSYTINKGDLMRICLRNKKPPHGLVDFNTLMFVLLHESAHIANYSSWGHDERFWTVFKLILHEAILAGIYRKVDYKAHPVDYCGLNIVYQPLDDTSLPDLWK